jgi:hypothetical protein
LLRAEIAFRSRVPDTSRRKTAKVFGNLHTEKARNLEKLRNLRDVLDAYRVKGCKKAAFNANEIFATTDQIKAA